MQTSTQSLTNKPFNSSSVFQIQTTPEGVQITTVLIREDEKISDHPAVFATLGEAIRQIDGLRAQVLNHFKCAAEMGLHENAINSTKLLQ